MSLISNLEVAFTYYGLAIIVISLLIGHLINKRVLKRNKDRKSQ